MQTKIRLEQCQIADLDPNCWTWTGAATNGYGSVSYHGRTWSSHKLAYVLLVGPVADGLTIDHLCLNKRCCNPAHLEPVTGLENTRRGLVARGYSRRDQPLPQRSPEEVQRALAMWDEFFNAGAASSERRRLA